MGATAPITQDHALYIDTDRRLEFVLYETLPTPTAAGVVRDAASMVFEWLAAPSRGVAPWVTKSGSGAVDVVGAFDADPEVNTQRIRVTLARADTAAIAIVGDKLEGVHQLRRTDSGLSDIVASGRIVWLKPAHVIA